MIAPAFFVADRSLMAISYSRSAGAYRLDYRCQCGRETRTICQAFVDDFEILHPPPPPGWYAHGYTSVCPSCHGAMIRET